MSTIYTSKELTSKIFSLQKIKEKEIEVQCDSVHHIPGKNIIELYLAITGNKSLVWKDNSKSKSRNSLFANIFILLGEFMVFPYLYFKVRLKFFKLPKKVKFFKYSTQSDFLYLRTDHWFNLTSGGSVGHVSGVVNELNKLSILTKLISTDELKEVNPAIPQTIVSPEYDWIKNIPDFPALYFNLQLIEEIPFQLAKDINVIYQRVSLGNFTGVYLKYLFHMPLILEFNGSEVWASEKWGGRKLMFNKLYKQIEKYNLTHADLIVVVSEPLRDSLILQGVDRNRILVNPNGVDLTKYHLEIESDSLRNKLNIADKKVFGFIGTFAEWHGVEVLAKAIVQFYKNHPNYLSSVRFLLIGAGNLLNQTKEIIHQNKLEEQVIFTDRIPQEDAPKYLSACDFFVSPHIPNPDGSKFFGSPTKLFEYMALKKPIIASDLGQIGEILKQNNCAKLVSPGSTDELAKAFTYLLENPDYADSIAASAYKEVQSHYTWEKHVSRIMEKTKRFASR